jgi:hypothetical protein
MIPSLTRSIPYTRRDSEWPELPHWGMTGSLFEERPALRRIVVMIDAELLTPPGTAVSRGFVLTALLDHPYVKLVRYRDEGPFPDTPLQSYGVGGTKAAPGWAVIKGKDADGRPTVQVADEESAALLGTHGNAGEYGRRATNSRAYPNLGPGDAADQREKDGLALQVASAVMADILVTERPYLFEIPSQNGVTVCKPDDALALAALYLRAQNEFIIWRQPREQTFSLDRELYFWVGTRELLPSAWRWNTACRRESSATGDPELQDLSDSLLQRVQRGLMTRDDFHLAFNKLQNNTGNSREVLARLDTMLVLLMSAVDTTARVAHRVLALAGPIYNVGWQRSSWIGSVAAADPALAAVFAANTNDWHALTILRLLRNTVHGQAISSIPVRLSGASVEIEIRLPADNQADIVASMDALGGRGTWGARNITGGAVQVNPAIFVERLWPEILRVLNDTMTATPVERLGNVNLAPADLQPPPDSTSGDPGTFDLVNRNSIRWQLGF